ncbi:MAG: hypothetical protein V3U92_19360 [Cellulophaga sp.]
MFIWTGAGLHATFLTGFIVWKVFGIDPDQSSARFFFAMTPVILILGILLNNFAYNLYLKWKSEENQKGTGYIVNKICSFLKCNFAEPPSVFFIPLTYVWILTLLIGIEEWIRVGL